MRRTEELVRFIDVLPEMKPQKDIQVTFVDGKTLKA